MMKLKLSPPWMTFYHEIQQLFKQDPDVFTVFDQEEMTIKVLVCGEEKSEALEHLLVKEKIFGNITVKVNVIPANEQLEAQDINYFDAAFSGNPVYVSSREIYLPVYGKMTYVVWTDKVAQFYNDDLSDINGNETMLFEDVARDVLIEEPGVFHCTVMRTFGD